MFVSLSTSFNSGHIHRNICCIYLRKRPKEAYWHVEYNSHGFIEAIHYWRPLNQNKNVQYKYLCKQIQN